MNLLAIDFVGEGVMVAFLFLFLYSNGVLSNGELRGTLASVFIAYNEILVSCGVLYILGLPCGGVGGLKGSILGLLETAC